MKSLLKVLLLTVLIAGFTGVAAATTDVDTQSVSVTFSEISEIAASGNPATLTIVAPATAGDLPADQTENSTTMAWTSNVASGQTRKISGLLYPSSCFSGINMHVTIAAPGGSDGTSAGEQIILPTSVDFVTGIGNCNVAGQTITFRAEVTEMVNHYTSYGKTVVWTLTEDS